MTASPASQGLGCPLVSHHSLLIQHRRTEHLLSLALPGDQTLCLRRLLWGGGVGADGRSEDTEVTSQRVRSQTVSV